jgi:2-polyprenyl-3-methyl-5-hydroxy-6-metoxy-1,4-benzoquinol methylase
MRTLTALLAAVLCSGPLYCQTRDQVEAKIAQLPPDERAYERFRYWVTMLPAAQQSDPELMTKYRMHLKQQGFADADVEAQVKTLAERGRRLEVERWNRILTDEKPRFNTNANAFLVEMAKDRKPGTALDVGMGQGRNSIWLAQQGWTVTGFDPADQAVALARKTAERLGLRLTTEIATDDSFDFGENRWDLILLSYVGGRDIAEKVQKALKPHGVVVIEAFHRDATKGTSIGGGVVFDTGELVRLFPALRAVRYEEPMAVSDFGQQRVRVVRYCAEKPE